MRDPDRPDRRLDIHGRLVDSTPRMRDAMLQLRANALRPRVQATRVRGARVRLQLRGGPDTAELAEQFAQLAALREPTLAVRVEARQEQPGVATLTLVGSGARAFVETVFSLTL